VDSLSKIGIKASTKGTTLYLLPDEQKRLKQLALDLDTSMHEMILQALDHFLVGHGQQPIRRYSSISSYSDQS